MGCENHLALVEAVHIDFPIVAGGEEIVVILQIDDAGDSGSMGVQHILGEPGERIPDNNPTAAHIGARGQIVLIFVFDDSKCADVGFMLLKSGDVVAVAGKNLNYPILQPHCNLVVDKYSTQGSLNPDVRWNLDVGVLLDDVYVLCSVHFYRLL